MSYYSLGGQSGVRPTNHIHIRRDMNRRRGATADRATMRKPSASARTGALALALALRASRSRLIVLFSSMISSMAESMQLVSPRLNGSTRSLMYCWHRMISSMSSTPTGPVRPSMRRSRKFHTGRISISRRTIIRPLMSMFSNGTFETRESFTWRRAGTYVVVSPRLPRIGRMCWMDAKWRSD